MSCVSIGEIKSDIAYNSVLERRHNSLVNSHTVTSAAATVTSGQPVIEVFMWENSPEPRPQNKLFGMQTDTLVQLRHHTVIRSP